MNIDDYCYEQSEPERSTKRNQNPLGPVQLAAKKCKCHHCQWNGEVKECEQKWITMNQMKAHYDKKSREPAPKKVSEPLSSVEKDISPPRMKILSWQKPVEIQDVAPSSPKKVISAWKKPLEVQDLAPASPPPKKTISAWQKPVEVQDLAPASPKKTISAWQKPVEVQDLAPASPKKTISAWQKPVEVQDLAPASPKKTISAWQKPVEVQDVAPASPKKTIAALETPFSFELPNTPQTTSAFLQSEPDASKANDVQVNIRAKAFSSLADIKKINGALLRTQMCDSVASQKACRHGASCRFAHNVDELVFANCLFGATCRHVKSHGNGVYTSVFGQTCNRLHPEETNASVCARSEIKIGPTKSTPNFHKQKTVFVSAPTQFISKEPTILRVPIEMALLAMESATKFGKTNIRIEII